MRKKIYDILNKIYAVTMTASFFAGLLPVFVFVAAIIIGGEKGEGIAIFLYNDYYKWVIFAASVSILIGLAAMYVGKKEGLSVKSVGKKNDERKA